MAAWLVLWLVLGLLAASADSTAGDRLYAEGRFADAARVYRELLRESPRDVKLLLRLGTTEYQMGLFAGAEAEFRKAIAIAPALEPVQVGLGVSLLSLDRSREAIPFLEKAVASAPADRMALRALGHAYQKENDLFRGEPILKSLVAADPNDAESWYYLGALLPISITMNSGRVAPDLDRPTKIAQDNNQRMAPAFRVFDLIAGHIPRPANGSAGRWP